MRQQGPRAGIDYKQDDAALRAASRVVLNEDRSPQHLHYCRGRITPGRLGCTVDTPGSTRGLSHPAVVLPRAAPFRE